MLPRLPAPRRKRPGRYHHGDLRRALVEQALRTIAAQGVEALTLRGVGQALGVSRTALYRHFADKADLLAAVATEGFRRLRDELTRAWDEAGRGRPGFEAQGRAYVRFAVENPAYYRVLFGRFVDTGGTYPDLEAEAAGAFGALVESLVEQQRMGIVLDGDPMPLARFVWATVHGIATLAIDGRAGDDRAIEALTAFAIARIESGIDRRPEHVEPPVHSRTRSRYPL